MKEETYYYVNCPGYSTICYTWKDALELYNHRKYYNYEVTLEKCTRHESKIVYSWKRK